MKTDIYPVSEVNRGNIDSYRQNKITLVVNDFEQLGIPATVTAKILMARGIYKWLANRRKIIKLKNRVRAKLTELYNSSLDRSDYRVSKAYRKGQTVAYQNILKELREICHSPRWQAPDFDEVAMEYLEDWREN